VSSYTIIGLRLRELQSAGGEKIMNNSMPKKNDGKKVSAPKPFLLQSRSLNVKASKKKAAKGGRIMICSTRLFIPLLCVEKFIPSKKIATRKNSLTTSESVFAILIYFPAAE